MGGEWSASRPSPALLPGKYLRYPMDRKLCGRQLVCIQRLEEKSLCLCRRSKPDRPSSCPESDNILTELSRFLLSLSLCLSTHVNNPVWLVGFSVNFILISSRKTVESCNFHLDLTVVTTTFYYRIFLMFLTYS
jgi:hypothetical protein